MIILVNTKNRELVEPVVRAFAGQLKFVQTAPPPVPFCARVKEVPAHLCQIGEYSQSNAPFVDLRQLSTEKAIDVVRGFTQAALDAPSLVQMGKSALGELIRWSTLKFGRCTEEQIQARLVECKQCPHWDENGFKGTGRCKKCGCSTWAKLKLKSSSCPDGRWHEIKIDETDNVDTVKRLKK